MVAHRPSTVLLADRVALLADGVIAALGTHHELLNRAALSRTDERGRLDAGDDGRAAPGLAGARR